MTGPLPPGFANSAELNAARKTLHESGPKPEEFPRLQRPEEPQEWPGEEGWRDRVKRYERYIKAAHDDQRTEWRQSWKNAKGVAMANPVKDPACDLETALRLITEAARFDADQLELPF